MKRILLLLVISFLVLLSIYSLKNIKPNKSNETTIDGKDPFFTFGEYTNCKIYLRSSMNIPSDESTLPDKSSLVCSMLDSDKTLFEITDKPKFETAKNSIIQVWYDNEGYKVMIVDQNGAGSGEGNGKIILVEKNEYKLLSCFYYTYESFHENSNELYGVYQPLTTQQIDSINENSIELSDPNCSNFTISIYME